MNGYTALRESAGWLELPGRGKIRLTGDDRARLLHAMSTNHIQQLTPGTGCYAFFLTAQGRILADVNILCLTDSFLLDTEPETAKTLYDHLDKYIIADDVTLEDLTSQLTAIVLSGPHSPAILSALAAPIPEARLDHREWQNCRIVLIHESTFFILTFQSEKEALVQALERAGAHAADPSAFRLVSLEQGHARYGEDFSDRFLAQEANQLDALHFQKGCYLGQEIVERVRSRGQVHRLLMPIEIQGTAAPTPGTKLPWGEITSAVFSPALNKVVGLAYVRTELAKPGVELDLQTRVR